MMAAAGLLGELTTQGCTFTWITAVPDGGEQALVAKDAVLMRWSAVPADPRRGRAIPCFRFQREWRE